MGSGHSGTPLERLALACLALVSAVLLGAAPLQARTVASTCHAFAAEGEAYAALAADPRRWTCGNAEWRDGTRPEALLRFDAAAMATVRSFVSRISSFDRITLAAVDAGGRVTAERSYPFDLIRPLGEGPLFALPLPPLGNDTAAVVVRVVHPWNALILSEARLSDQPAGEGWGTGTMLLIAALCGLLAAPVLFNCVYWMVLRERFVLWHSAMAAGMLVYTLVSSGLVMRIAPISPGLYTLLSPLSFMLPVAAAGMFAASYLEPFALSHRMRTACRLAAPWTLVLAGTFSLHWEPLRPVANAGFYLCFVPVLAVYAAAMAQALARGSRAVRFQLAGWAPMMAVCSERLGRGMGFWDAPHLIDQAIYLACVLEIMITALGVADRFLVIKRQRDQAQTSIGRLRDEAERDSLTGLYNRRGIEGRFAEFRRAGFDTLAVVDLDHFKAVNDAMGHAVGDKVLSAVAAALKDDPDLIAWRLGGEEFLLLLRGRNAAGRAEARRQAIPTRVAALVPGLPGPLTASMGLVEMPRGEMLATSYAELYARADHLLYEAKHTGRNRTCAEKLTLFDGANRRKGGDRRRHARQAA